MRRIIFILGCSLCFLRAGAQEVKLSYFGESITHYGLKGAYALTLRATDRDTRKGKPINHAYAFSPGVAIYRHPQNHIGIIILPELSYKRKRETGGFIEAGLAPGLFKTFLEGKTFEVSPEGELERVRLAGRLAFLPTAFFGFGNDLSTKKDQSLSWYARIILMKQIPYNASSLTRFAIELGISKPLTF